MHNNRCDDISLSVSHANNVLRKMSSVQFDYEVILFCQVSKYVFSVVSDYEFPGEIQIDVIVIVNVLY